MSAAAKATNVVDVDVLPADPLTAEEGANAVDARRVVRKIDRRLVPLIFVTCLFFFMDKSILSSAAVFKLRTDNGLVGQQYSWVSSVFYFGYIMYMYPTTLLCARLPIGKYLTGNTLIWGIVVGTTAACHNFGGLITVRFLLGVCEATIDPAFMFITSTWYTRDEIPIRTGVWFTGNSVGGIISNLFAFGVGHIHDDMHPWRWMYIILGIATFLWAFGIWALLPDSIATASFLTEEERQFAQDRVVIAGTGRTDKMPFRFDQVIECMVDPKTWLIFAITLCMQIPNGGTQSFGNLVLKSFGFSSLHSTLIQIPPGVIVAVTIAVTGYIAGRYRNLHILMIILVVLPPIAGSAMIYRRAGISKGVQLFAYMMLSTGPAPMPLLMSLIQANYKGVTKKATMTTLLFFAYCTGNIVGPQLFKTSEEPVYNSAFQAIMICYSLAVMFSVILRAYLMWTNAKRTRVEGIEGSSSASGVVGGGKVVDVHIDAGIAEAVHDVVLCPEDYEDVTDWKTIGFRYRY
ncbi:allantoate permease [Ophiostoma piceae UAMH 11346]|uniref:Allantoate permease n=1 Tax=Ophiostoma piceae (strain UAMH 11346) TaxID=1262450 RepID=S3CPW8_OPHP1|nr:allantoate permease [Ophiostoma piceae UAMH 11346]